MRFTRGAKWLVADALKVTAKLSTAPVVVRADSAFYGSATVGATLRAIVAVFGHCPHVGLFGPGAPIPSDAEEPAIEGGPTVCRADSRIDVGNRGAGGLIPRVLA